MGDIIADVHGAGRRSRAPVPHLGVKECPPAASIRAAPDDRVVSEFALTDNAAHVDDRTKGKLLEVFVPVRDQRRVVAVAELYLPYDAVASTVARDGRMLVLLLFGGLALLWVTLFRIVSRASRRLVLELARNEHQALHDALTALPNPDAAVRPGGACAGTRQAGGVEHRGTPARPGPVQGGERHPRAPQRRPSAAEGVEDASAWDALQTVACDQLQGFFLARPLPETEVEAWTEEYLLHPRRPRDPAAAVVPTPA